MTEKENTHARLITPKPTPMRNRHPRLHSILLAHRPPKRNLGKPIIDLLQDLRVSQRRARIRDMVLNPVVDLIAVFVEMERGGAGLAVEGIQNMVRPVFVSYVDEVEGSAAEDEEEDDGFGRKG